MTEHRARVEELLAGYRRSREQLASAHAELSEVSASASGADGLVTATVGARGVLTGLEIDDGAYARFRPDELAAHIVRAATTAAAEALRGAGEVMAPVLGQGADSQALLLGTADLTAAELASGADTTRVTSVGRGDTSEHSDDSEDDFADQNWLADDAEWSKAR